MVIAADFDRSWHEFEGLANALDALILPSAADWADGRELQERAIRTIRSYLVPRVKDPELPMLVVFAGPTGAGKSTLLNSVAGRDLTETGPLRPTTTAPVVFVSDAAAGAYRNIGGVDCEVVEGRAAVLSEMALVDTPDIDSTALEHRAMAEVVIDNADVVVFVGSALRYADLVPWEVLRRAGSRGAPVINVLNRIRVGSEGALYDYVAKLKAERLDPEVVAVHEHHMRPGAQSIPLVAVRDLRRRLVEQLGVREERARAAFGQVLAATVIQVGEIIESSRHALEESKRAVSKAEDAIQFAPLDPGELLGDRGLGMDLDSLVALEGRPRRQVIRWVRRNRAGTNMIPATRRQMVHGIVASVEADIRKKLRVAGGDPRTLSEAIYEILLLSVEGWAQSVEGSLTQPATGGADLLALLVMAAVAGSDERCARAAEVLNAGEDMGPIIETARDALTNAVAGVYRRVLDKVVGELREEAPTEAQVEAVWTHLSELIGRSSFAYA